MTAVIKTPGRITKSVGIIAPVTSGLKMWHYPAVDAARSLRDFSANADGSIVGAPTYDAAYMVGGYDTQGNGLQTGMSASPSLTFGIVFRRETTFAETPVLVGIRESTAPFILGYLSGGGSGHVLFKFYDGSNTAITLTSAFVVGGGTSWEMAFFAADDKVGADASTAQLYIPGHSEMVTQAYTGPRKLSIGNVRVGVAGDAVASSQPGEVKIAWAAGWNRALSSDEMDATYAFVKSELARLNSLAIV